MSEAESLSLDQFEDFREIAAKRVELRCEARALEVKAADLQAQLYEASLKAGDDRLDAEAAKLLNGAGVAPLDGAGADALAELNQTRQKQRVVHRARQIHEPNYEEVKGRRGAELAERLVPRHRAAVERIAAALRELEAANRAEEAVRLELQQAGVTNSMLIPAAGFPGIGHLLDLNAPVYRWLAWAGEKGFDVEAAP